MKDIDFDELDKAVSSVLHDEPEKDSDTSVSVTTDAAVRPATVTPPERSTPSPSLPAKRRGQFMDVVHPSSDMTTASATASKPKMIVQPISPSNEVVPEPDAPTRVDAVAEPEESLITPPVTPGDQPTSNLDTIQSSTSHDWPDPLDVMSEREESTQAATQKEEDTAVTVPTNEAPTPTAPEPAETPVIPEPGSDEASEPAQTPFLDGTKVEKRPLGAFATDDLPHLETEENAPEEAVADSATKSEPKTEELPPELDSKLVALEEQRDLPGEQDDPDKPKAEATTVPAPLVGQSIPQQYQPVTTAASDQAHSVFDTEQYHQPLLPADTKRKKSKALLIVIIILVMLALGAGLGYLAFIYGLLS